MKARNALIALVFASGCASEPTYPEQVAAIQIPQDDEGRQHFCGWVRGEIASQQTTPIYVTNPYYRPALEAMRAQNIAALEQKASEAHCGAAFGSDPAPKPLNDCFNLCKKATGRTDAECFDQCNK